MDAAAVLQDKFALKEITPEKYRTMGGPLMRFFLEQYNVEGLGNLCVLKTKAMLGLMQLVTVVVTPSSGKNVPFLLVDTMDMGKKHLCYVEYYDCTADGADKDKLLRDIVFSASRMLLVTRGADPRTDDEVYANFETLFIEAGIVSADFKQVVEKARHGESLIAVREQVDALAAKVIELYANMDDSLQFKTVAAAAPQQAELTKTDKVGGEADVKKDFRGVACPMNFVKTKIQLSTMQSGQLLEILLDDGQPINNVPGSVRQEGHEVLSTEKVNDYWKVLIRKK